MKKTLKKALALVLCMAVLTAGFVYAMPAGNAQETVYDKYYVEMTVQVHEGSWYDRAFVGPNLNKDSDAGWKDQGGVYLEYQSNNGYGEDVDYYVWDFGQNAANEGSDTYNLSYDVGVHTISATISGFPTAFYTYNHNDTPAYWLSNRTADWSVLEVKIGASADSDLTTLWKGQCKQYSQTDARGYKVSIDGSASLNTYCSRESHSYILNSKNEYLMPANSSVENEANREPWQLPVATSVGFSSGNNNWADELVVDSDATVFSPTGYAFCKDQYGVKLLAPHTAYNVVSYNGEDAQTASTVDANFIESIGDICFDQKTGKIFAGENGYIAGGKEKHPLSLHIYYTLGGGAAETVCASNVCYPQKSVTWKYKLSTYSTGTPEWKSVYSTPLFGDTVTDADYPGSADTRVYFDADYHYLNGTFESRRVTDNTILYMQGYSEAQAHALSTYEAIEGNESVHNHLCICGYTEQEKHRWNEGKVTTPATCTQTGVLTLTCTDCGAVKTSEIPMAAHSWDAGVITTPPTCGVRGEKTYTCTNCHQTYTEPVNALEHEPVLKDIAPSDKHDGGVYFECENCGCYWGAVYSEALQDYDIPDETPISNLEDAIAASDSLPAPYFNTFVDEAENYDYSTRGASLKYIHLKTPDYQPLRFTASVKVPENVSAAIGSEGNAIKDVGIIYSQTQLMDSLDDLQIGKENVYKMSVKEKNSAPVYDGSNWGGITTHTTPEGTQLSFNLVVNVKPSNWTSDYCARAYITYDYNGFEYTVYDEAFSSRSVQYIAQCVVNNPAESQEARDYCQHTILDNIV